MPAKTSGHGLAFDLAKEKFERSRQPQKTGAGLIVAFCGHNAEFVADVYRVGNAIVVKANGPVYVGGRDTKLLKRPIKLATIRVSDYLGGFFRPDLGIFVVPEEAVTFVAIEERRAA